MHEECKCPSLEGSNESHIIHIDCVSHIYPDGTTGIHNMCFVVREREIVVVCGANGSGKSTLLEHLNGLLLPSSGSVYVMGKKVEGMSRNEIWKYVGIIFQHPDEQLFAPTVLDDVMFGPVNMGVGLKEAKEIALASLEQVGASSLINKVPNYLSGGQKRLVSIAGIIAMKPKVIAMDEPTADLDAVHAGMIERIIRSMRDDHGNSVVIATHDLNIAARLADRVCVLKGGSIIADGSPREIFYDRGLLEDAGLKPPKAVELYRRYCEKKGKEITKRPLTDDELLMALDGCNK